MSRRDHLVVEMHVDALSLAAPRMVVSGGLDHSRLPFFDGRRDVHGDVPFLSDAVASRPFQDLDVELGAGVHLHWTLPAALRDGVHDADGVAFPAVPNRWLVTRTAPGSDPASWVVESDYLHPSRTVPGPTSSASPSRRSRRRVVTSPSGTSAGWSSWPGGARSTPQRSTWTA